jgi:hypothetical protein
MESFIACRCSMSFADAPLAEAGLDCSLFHLDVMATLQGAADRITTDSVVEEGYDLLSVGL